MRERAQWRTAEKTKPARQDELAVEETGSERQGKHVRTMQREQEEQLPRSFWLLNHRVSPLW